MERKILTPDEWHLVAAVVEGVFNNAMPRTPAQATFPAILDGDGLAAFAHVEQLLHFNCVYVAPEHREGRLGFELMRYAVEDIPGGFSGVWLSDRRVDRMARALGARLVGQYWVYRRDN